MLTYRGTIYPWHCDHVGHMNVMWYVGKFDEATWQLFNSIRLTPTHLRTAHRGMAAVDQHISYIKELHAGTTISINSAVRAVHAKRIEFVHEMRNDDTGEIAARTKIIGVYLDTQARKSCHFPDEVIAAANALIASPETDAF
jgi:acyl-CoA thioester hydrolase